MRATVKAALGNESGNVLVQAMTGAIVSLVSIGAVAAGITGIAQFQVKQQLRADVAHQAAITDAAFRGDVMWAAGIHPVDDHRVEFTGPGPNGGCEASTWIIEEGTGNTQVRVTTTSYPELGTEAGRPACTGEAAAPYSVVLIDDASPESTFSYSNAAGRALSYGEATLQPLDGAGRPDGVSDAAWNDPQPAAAALQTAVKASTQIRAGYRFAQTADHLQAPAPAADAPVHFVPEGDLR